ncbi:MAG: cytochrome c [Flavobacteriales bacterium]|nr:cytochrome c [Flavobacteriales bacterium]
MIRMALILSLACLPPLWQGPSVADATWTAPPSADALKDPLADDPKAVQKGGKVFHALCWTCHGVRGTGDGPNATALRVRPADLGFQHVQVQSNGALFWKITHGRGEMAAYEQVLSREDRWALVHYLRTLAHP